jgi:hypothetical protein
MLFFQKEKLNLENSGLSGLGFWIYDFTNLWIFKLAKSRFLEFNR